MKKFLSFILVLMFVTMPAFAAGGDGDPVIVTTEHDMDILVETLFVSGCTDLAPAAAALVLYSYSDSEGLMFANKDNSDSIKSNQIFVFISEGMVCAMTRNGMFVCVPTSTQQCQSCVQALIEMCKKYKVTCTDITSYM